MALRDIIELLEKQRHPDYIESVHGWRFLRAALEEKLRGPYNAQVPDLMQSLTTKRLPATYLKNVIEKSGGQPEGCYLIRQRVESPKAFAERLSLSHDGGESGQILNHYTGHMSRATTAVSFDGWAEPQAKLVQDNIDCMNTTHAEFRNEVFYELAGLGWARVLVWTKETMSAPDEYGRRTVVTRPYMKLLRREDVLDWHEQDGEYMFITFRDAYDYINPITYKRTRYEKIVRLTPSFVEQIIKPCNDDRADWVYSKAPNPHGRVPIAEASMGRSSRSIVAVPASLQFLVFNAESVWSQKIRQQNMNILTVPQQEDIDAQLKTLSTNTYLRIRANGYEPKWLGYPTATLEGDKEYINYLVRRVYESSNTNSKNTETQNAPESGRAKILNFMDSLPVLNAGATGMDAIFQEAHRLWADMASQPQDGAIFKHGRNFDPQTLNNLLDVVIKALAVRIGDTATTKARIAVRDGLGEIGVSFTDAEKKKSDKEIEKITGETDNESTIPSGVDGRDTEQPTDGANDTAAQ